MATYARIDTLSAHVGSKITVRGWIYNKRSSGKLHFLEVRDGSGTVQCVVFKGNVSEELFESADKLPQETSLMVTGTVIERGNRLGQDSSVLVATNRRNPLADPCTARASRLPACGPPELTSVYGSHILHL